MHHSPTRASARRTSARRIAIAVAALLAVLFDAPHLAAGATLTETGAPITNRAGQTFVVVAHRGGMDSWPQNSVEAYQHAAEADFEAIEADIVFTKDLLPVMTHDDLVQPHCTSAGLRIHNLTWAEVSQIRCADRSGELTVPIPTFAELAAIIAAHPGVGLFLDIKSFAGQSAASRRAYAKWSVDLVKKAGLLDRTRFITFSWDKTLPTLRKYAPQAYLVALDHAKLSFSNAKLAARLGADAYGVGARYSTATLARYVRSLGMDYNPWQLTDREAFASSIYFGPKKLWLSSDSPGLLQEQLRAGTLDINPAAVPVTQTLLAPVKISAATYRAKKLYYPTVRGTAVPATDEPMLESINLKVRISGLAGKAKLYLGGRGTAYREVKLTISKKTKTVQATVIMGNAGKLRIWCDHKVKLTVEVTGYTRLRFPQRPGATFTANVAGVD